MTVTNKTILFMDIRNSTKLWDKYNTKVVDSIRELHNIILRKLKQYNNAFIFKIVGDSFMIVFNNIIHGVKFSIEISKLLTDDKTSIYLDDKKKDRITTRIGICYGDVNVFKIKIQNCEQKDYFGNIVNIASRMESGVSPINGFAIAFTKETEKDIPRIQKIIEKEEKLNIKAFNLKKIKKVDKFKKSGKLLFNLFFINDSLEKLKGIQTKIKVFKVSNIDVTEKKSFSVF